MSLMERFPRCDGGDYPAAEYEWHLATAALLYEVDRLTERVAALERATALAKPLPGYVMFDDEDAPPTGTARVVVDGEGEWLEEDLGPA